MQPTRKEKCQRYILIAPAYVRPVLSCLLLLLLTLLNPPAVTKSSSQHFFSLLFPFFLLQGTECASCERFLAQPWLAELVVPKTHFGVVRLASKTVKNSLNVLGPTSVTFAQDVDLSRFYLPVPGRSSQGHGISLSRVRSIRVLSGFPPHHVESLCCMLPQLGVLQHLAVHWTHADAVCGRLEELRDLRSFCGGEARCSPRCAPLREGDGLARAAQTSPQGRAPPPPPPPSSPSPTPSAAAPASHLSGWPGKERGGKEEGCRQGQGSSWEG